MQEQPLLPPGAMLHDLLDDIVARFPDRPAIVSAAGEMTYRELADVSRKLATAFTRLDIRRGDRIIILVANSPAVVATLMAASRLGALFSVINTGIKSYHLRYIIEDAEPALVVTTTDRVYDIPVGIPVLKVDVDWPEILQYEAYTQPAPGISTDPACLIYTSGSTGKPKAVISSHRNVIFAAQAIQSCLQIQETDVIGNFLPMSFDVGLYQVFLSLLARATLALGLDADVGPGLLNRLCEWKVTCLPAVPNLVSILLRLSKRASGKLPNLRFVTNTGAHLPQTHIRDLRELFPACQVFVMYGLTECKRVSILQPSDYARKTQSVGKPLPATECIIIGPDQEILPPGSLGELVVRGPHVMLGYWRSPEITALRFRPWGVGTEIALFTGDTCSMDEEGYLYFHGRSDDIYKQNGYRVSALEVEAAAYDIPGVQQAALLLPTQEMGALLFVASDLGQDSIFTELRSRLEDYKLPTQVIVLNELPLTLNGKLDKRQLLEILERERCITQK